MSIGHDPAAPEPTARAVALPGDVAAWKRLGFAPGEPIGDVAVTCGAWELALAVHGLAADRPDGLPIVSTGAGPAGHGEHPNGALVIDHVVALTAAMERTLAAPARAGLELRRERRAP